jgi:hypothetical protein
MPNKKFLIIEFTAHFRNAQDNFYFFSKLFDCFFLINDSNKNKIKLNSKKKIIFKYPKFLIYFYILLNGFKYRYIYISTPHEYPDYPKGFKQNLLFIYEFILNYLIIKIYTKKIILQLRGLHRYFPKINKKINQPTIFSYFRNLYLNECRYIVCESFFLKKTLIKELGFFKSKNKKIYVIYYAYPKKNQKIKIQYKKKLNIGILGSVDPFRKNYDQLIKLITNNYFNKEKLTITILGSAGTEYAKNKINEISKYCKKIIHKDYLSNKEFYKYGSKCDFLLSLNTKNNFYGKYRMSGCFGDAIVLKKPLFCPYFEDPYREFANFTFYFKSIKEILYQIKKNLNTKRFIKFNTLNLLENYIVIKKKFNNE